MFGECHAHIIMDGLNFRRAIGLHKNGVQDSVIRQHFHAYETRGITFIRDGGDNLGVSLRAKELAFEYNIDYRTPAFAIHKKGYYGSIVGLEFTDMREYAGLVKLADQQGCDFIKIMISGIMDFNHAGVLSCPPLLEEEIQEMIHIAHESGLAVMAHCNGKHTCAFAALHGADSIEHGNFLDREVLELLAKKQVLYVPTSVTVKNLVGSGRFPDSELVKIMNVVEKSIKNAWDLKVPIALGSDAGAYLVPHGQGLVDEYNFFHKILGSAPAIDEWLQGGESLLKERFRRI